MKKRNYKINYEKHHFNAEDDWGDYFDGKRREPWFNKHGYSVKRYIDIEGKPHNVMEHVVKWEYFNGEIPEGYEIDHIIPIKDGGTNKLSNLRLVTHQENCNNEHSKENYRKAKLGKKFSEEHKKKIGDANKGHKKMLGKHHSEETKQIISKRQINRKDLSKQVAQISMDGQLIKIYQSLADASRNTNIKKGDISNVCHHRQNTAGGFKWSLFI